MTQLVGFWKVLTIDMVRERTVSLVGGLPGEVVEFTADGRYLVWDDAGPLGTGSRFKQTETDHGVSEMDIWIPGLESLRIQGILRFTADGLELCVAGDSGERPNEFRRDDRLLWCLLSFSVSDQPVVRKRRRRPLLQPGKLIPHELFEQPGRKRSR